MGLGQAPASLPGLSQSCQLLCHGLLCGPLCGVPVRALASDLQQKLATCEPRAAAPRPDTGLGRPGRSLGPSGLQSPWPPKKQRPSPGYSKARPFQALPLPCQPRNPKRPPRCPGIRADSQTAPWTAQLGSLGWARWQGLAAPSRPVPSGPSPRDTHPQPHMPLQGWPSLPPPTAKWEGWAWGPRPPVVRHRQEETLHPTPALSPENRPNPDSDPWALLVTPTT